MSLILVEHYLVDRSERLRLCWCWSGLIRNLAYKYTLLHVGWFYHLALRQFLVLHHSLDFFSIEFSWLRQVYRLLFRRCSFRLGLLCLQLLLCFKWRHLRFLYNCVATLQRADDSCKYVLVMLILFLHDRWVLPLHPANGMIFFLQLFLISACLGWYTANF